MLRHVLQTHYPLGHLLRATLFLFLIYVHESVPAYVFMCTTFVQVPMEDRRRVSRFPRTGVIVVCEVPGVGAGN